jgi:hypothetical protein
LTFLPTTFSGTPDITRNLRDEQCQKAHAFAKHITGVIEVYPSENEHEEAEYLIQLLEASYQPKSLIKHLTRSEVQEVISNLYHKKSSYDLVAGNILKELPINGIKYLTQLFNTVLLKGYIPA